MRIALETNCGRAAFDHGSKRAVTFQGVDNEIYQEKMNGLGQHRTFDLSILNKCDSQ